MNEFRINVSFRLNRLNFLHSFKTKTDLVLVDECKKDQDQDRVGLGLED